ncbi:hypothetical protein Mycch_1875 [Mycolicibacterium chubuense NBB4]|uniref:Secreted protein n=1 Tax=Mycolicibacterium chubuense (strain NBB4) TaxID=710421 RepID=I4BHA5_MYCCN|nr:hypothetical protein [Mycolicibacterium chubuense]AFM16662.1 hypothetical protein Mycch_1875 [Mycolicibacterium chubuense NBB4]
MSISRPLVGLAVCAAALWPSASGALSADQPHVTGIVPATASATTTTVAQNPAQPWDPGCWGPFSWNNQGCQWAPTMGSNDWVPDPFSRGGTGSTTTGR